MQKRVDPIIFGYKTVSLRNKNLTARVEMGGAVVAASEAAFINPTALLCT